MNTSFPDRLQDIGESIFTRMSLMSKQHNSINLGQGFPDFAPPAELIELTYRYAKDGFNQYAHSAGLPELREALSGKIERLYGTGYDAESEITITSGATEALFCAILCTIQPGDEVLIIEPAYDSYAPAVRMAGGNPIYYAIDIQDPQIDWTDLEARITASTKMLIINNPHNPLGIVFGQEDIDSLEHIAVAHDLWLIADEVYEHITLTMYIVVFANPEF